MFFTNNFNHELEKTFDMSGEYGQTWEEETSVTLGFSAGMSFSLEEGIEGIAKATETFEVKMEMSTTESYKHGETKTLTVSDATKLTLQPGECVHIKEVLSTLSYDATYSVNQKASNYFEVNYPDKVKDHYIWFVPLSYADQSKITRKAEGKIKAQVGTTHKGFAEPCKTSSEEQAFLQ